MPSTQCYRDSPKWLQMIRSIFDRVGLDGGEPRFAKSVARARGGASVCGTKKSRSAGLRRRARFAFLREIGFSEGSRAPKPCDAILAAGRKHLAIRGERDGIHGVR